MDVPHRVDDVVALAPAGGELEDHLRRILEIAVEHDHRVAQRDVDAGSQRDLVSEVAGELDEAETRLLPRRLDQQLVGAVAAAVVDDDRLRLAVEQVHDVREARDES